MSQQIVATLKALSASTLRIREQAQEQMRKEAEREKERDKKHRLWNLETRKQVHERLVQAQIGVLALCEIGKSPELQELMARTGAPHQVWGGTKHFGMGMHVSADILLGKDALMLTCDEARIRIPYDLPDHFIIRQTLRKIATPKLRDSYIFEVLAENLSALLVDEVIFEELVNYADASYLERRFAVGPSPFELIVDDELEDWG